MKSKIGILMPVASLPNRFGSGDFGPDTYRFVDDISKAGFSIWQLLPMNPLGYGNSPYQPFSSYAMDEMYISLDRLAEKYDLPPIPDHLKKASSIDYGDVNAFREQWLRMAFEQFQPDDDYRWFVEHEKWLEDYAVFMAFKHANDNAAWTAWPKKMRDYPQERKLDLEPYRKEIDFQRFLQFTLFHQWSELKEYANEKGILIMGDIPFYVGLDSADCWGNRSNFLLTKDGRPRFIAGVPPDYFSAIGQRWGNPIYDWEQLEKDDFRFWMDRLGYNHTHGLFDITRIDHFRAFDTYWKIPSTCPTAIEGEWIEAPGYKVLERLYKEYPDIEIVAEDLGDLRAEVYQLRDHFNLPGMNILQFTFNPDSANEVNPHSLAYTGTHDNETIAGFYHDLPASEKARWRKWFKKRTYEGKNIPDKFVSFALHCGAEMIIIPMADWLLLGKKATLNHPGSVGSPNWEWRLSSFDKFEAILPEIHRRIKEIR